MKLSPAVKKETLHIAVGVTVLCAVMLGVFFAFGKFSLPVLWGGLLGSFLAVLNFFLMCVSKQHELQMQPVKGKNFSILSYNLRMLFVLACILLAYFLLKWNLIALAVPLIFPRITIFVMSVTIMRKKEGDK